MTEPLAGDRPVFLLHRSHQAGPEFGALANEVSSVAGGSAELGAVVSLVYQGPNVARRVLGSLPGYSILIADPDLHERPTDPAALSDTRRRHAPYLLKPATTSPNATFIADILKAQRDAGATVLLTPTGRVTELNAENSLRQTMRWVSATRATGPSEPLLVNLTLSHAWIADSGFREILLNEIVDSKERSWYLRVRWHAPRVASGQLADRDLLEGYKHLAQVMASEDKVLLLPQTGLVGWLMGAFGALGFSVGTGGPQRSFADRVEMRRKGTPPPPIPRYFEPSLLHRIAADTRRRLASRSGYRACTCTYCDGLTRGKLISGPRQWNERDAHHYIASLAALQASPATTDRRAEVRRVVTAARATEAAIAPPLRGDDRPTHLSTWDDLLRP